MKLINCIDCMAKFSDEHVSRQVLFDHDLIFTINCLVLSFCVLVYFSLTISNRLSIFGVWNDRKMYLLSVGLSDLDVIFMVHWSMLNFMLVYVCFLDTLSSRSSIPNA